MWRRALQNLAAAGEHRISLVGDGVGGAVRAAMAAHSSDASVQRLGNGALSALGLRVDGAAI